MSVEIHNIDISGATETEPDITSARASKTDSACCQPEVAIRPFSLCKTLARTRRYCVMDPSLGLGCFTVAAGHVCLLVLAQIDKLLRLR